MLCGLENDLALLDIEQERGRSIIMVITDPWRGYELCYEIEKLMREGGNVKEKSVELMDFYKHNGSAFSLRTKFYFSGVLEKAIDFEKLTT